MIFKNYTGWRQAFEAAGCVFDHRTTAAFRLVEHTQIYGYTDRVMVFSKTHP